MTATIHVGDCREVLRTMAGASVDCIVTSPPYYGLRDYGIADQIGLEQTPDEYVSELVAVFREARRVLRDEGVLWLNLGDSYAGSGKGGNPEDGKQATNKSSQTIGVTYGAGKSQKEAAVANVTRKTFDGIKAKDLIGIPWMVAFALRADGWYLRQDIIWAKPNPMPESVQDRCTKAHEYVFLLSKSPRYLYDAEAIAEVSIYQPREDALPSGGYSAGSGRNDSGTHLSGGFKRSARTKDQLSPDRKRNGDDGSAESFRAITEKRNKRSVWAIPTQPFSEAHFATMAPELARICIMAGCPLGGTVLDPFGGAGTTAVVADRLQRSAVLIELNPVYADIARSRINDDAGMFGAVA